MDDHLGLIRISGLVAWYLLIAEVILGTMISGGVAKVTAPYRRKLALHAVVSWSLLLVTALHIGAILNQHYKGWGLVDVSTVSLAGPLARDLGVVAAWLLVVVFVTVHVKRFIPLGLWKHLHRSLPFVVLVFGTAHGLLAGTRGTTLPVILPGVVALTLLASVFLVRSNVTHQRTVRRRPTKAPRYRHVRPRKKAA